MTKPKIAVDIWSDVMCPWCAIGYTAFAQAVDELAGELEVEVRWMPFELNPGLPPEGKDQAQHLAEVYGRAPEETATMRAQMLAVAERIGFSMAWTGEGPEPPGMMWNTFDAHKLLRWALATAGPEAQTRLKLALLKAYLQQRRNVSDHAMLLDLAEAEGFDRAKAAEALDDEALAIAVRSEEQRGRQGGITSVPSFVIAGRYLFQGAREVADYKLLLRQFAGLVQHA